MKSKKINSKTTAVKIGRMLAKTSVPEIGFITSFILSRYLLNADFQYISEVVIPIIFFGVIATAAFYIYKIILKSWFAARISALPFIYALYSYTYLPKILKNITNFLLPKTYTTDFSGSAVMSLIIFVACGLFGWGVNIAVQHHKFLKNLQLHRIVLFSVLFIFVIQVVKTANVLYSIRHQLTYRHTPVHFERDATKVVKKPDIYYFVFDRYASQAALADRFKYDNSDVTNYLKNQGFVTNTEAYANYPFTMSSIGSTMAMGYHTELSKLFANDTLQSGFPYRTILNDPPIVQILKRDGYTYNHVSSWWDFTRVGIQADTHATQAFRLRFFGKNFFLSDLTRDITNKSVMNPWLKKGLTIGNKVVIKYDKDFNPVQNFYAQKDEIKSIASTAHSSPQFTFAHILVPHTPYVFDANGSKPSYDEGQNDAGTDESVKYINAVMFANSQLKDMVDHIRAKNPQAVIIIQSDEGPYPKQFRHALTPSNYYDPARLPIDDEKSKFSVLASYYMPGVAKELVKDNITTSVNSFRFVLQQYLGYKVDMLPVCHFSTGNKYIVFRFTNETPKLLPNASDNCRSL